MKRIFMQTHLGIQNNKYFLQKDFLESCLRKLAFNMKHTDGFFF